MKKLLVAGFCLLGALCFMQAQNVDWKNMERELRKEILLSVATLDFLGTGKVCLMTAL